MSRKTVALYVFEGIADWETALAMCEINMSLKYRIVTVALDRDFVKTRGGMRISPDKKLEEVDLRTTAMVVLPGGDMWEEGNQEVREFLFQCYEYGVPIAAICGATLELARVGLLDRCQHTSNFREYIEKMVPDYRGAENYVDELAVRDGNIITASGLGSVEFAREILDILQVHEPKELDKWYEMFKQGVVAEHIRNAFMQE